ncbi:MAG: dependent protein [Miltoncostaeaceae bacterium]|nr:dependent protein [Miltoncostaeaceae bacterium]
MSSATPHDTAAPPGALDAERLAAAAAEVREELDAGAAVSGRPAGAVTLVFAGKYLAPADTPALLVAGLTLVGENRLQDLEARQEVAEGRLTFDFIGHLQRRKVRDVLPAIRLLHSLDSEGLAEEIAKRAGGETRVLVQVNVGEEGSKGGIFPSRLRDFVRLVSAHPQLVIGGLMAMPPAQSVAERSRRHFAIVRELRDEMAREWAGRHDFRDLSMGTSQDYAVAAEEGATMVRVGRTLIARAAVA